jgi:hypothetical protein
MYPRGSQASRYLTGQRTGRRAHISVKAPPPSPETGHNGFGSVDALREEIESRHPRVSWVSHVHGPYPYPVIRRGRSNRSSPEGCGTPCVVGEGEGPLVGTPALPHLALIHRSAWNRYSANFALTEFSEVVGSAAWVGTLETLPHSSGEACSCLLGASGVGQPLYRIHTLWYRNSLGECSPRARLYRSDGHGGLQVRRQH